MRRHYARRRSQGAPAAVARSTDAEQLDAKPAVRPDRRPAPACWKKSPRSGPSRTPCSACCKAMWVAARLSSPHWPPCKPWKMAGRRPSWRPPRFWPNSITEKCRAGSRRWASKSRGFPAARAKAERYWLHASLLPSGTAKLAVGTHALFQDQVQFAKLGLAIVDEQHRFGVHQRLALRQKGAQPASTDDERHADSTHAFHELLRRSGCVGDRRTTTRTHPGRHQTRFRYAP